MSLRRCNREAGDAPCSGDDLNRHHRLQAKIVKGHESVDFIQTSKPVRRNYCRWCSSAVLTEVCSCAYQESALPLRWGVLCSMTRLAFLTADGLQEAIPGMRPRKIVPAGVLEHGEDGRLVCWDDPALQPSCHIFYGASIQSASTANLTAA